MAFGNSGKSKKGACSFSNDFIDEARSVSIVVRKANRALSRARAAQCVDNETLRFARAGSLRYEML